MTTRLDQFIEQSREHDKDKLDYRGFSSGINSPTYKFEFTGNCDMVAIDQLSGIETDPRQLTDTAWSQVGEKLGVALFSTGSRKTIPKPMIDASVRHKDPNVRKGFSGYLNALVGANQRDWMVRTYQKDVRAVLSRRYAPVGNTEMLLMIDKAFQIQKDAGVEVEGFEFSRPVLTPDDLHLQVIVKGIDPKDPLAGSERDYLGGVPQQKPYGVGFYISNNETGTGGLSVLPMIKRGRCDNSIIIDDHRARVKTAHIGLREQLLTDITVAIADALSFTEEYMLRLLGSRTIQIPSFDKVVSQFADAQGWNGEQISTLSRGTEGHQTLYGLVSGVSWMAHKATTNHDNRIATEKLAGQLLHEPRKLFGAQAWVVDFENRARTMQFA